MNNYKLKKEFSKYVKNFNIKDEMIYYKWKHSFKVMNNSVKIASFFKIK